MMRDASRCRRRPEHGPGRVRATTADPTPSRQINPHLHNVPMQIAAERGLPALAIWLWFIVGRRASTSPRASGGSRPAVARRGGAGGDRGDARRRAVRVQLRRLRVPDAVPRAHHAAVRRGRRPLPTRTHDAAAARRRAARRDLIARFARPSRPRRRRRDARSLHRRPRHAHLAGGAGAGRPVPVRVRPPGRRRQRRAQPRRARRAGVARRRGRRGCGGRSACASSWPRRNRQRTAWSRTPAGPTTRRCGSSPTAISRSRGSTTKTTATSPATSSSELIERASRRWDASAKALLVSDYLKGTITRRVMRRAASTLQERRRAAARRSEDSAPRLLRGRDARHAEPSRGRGRDAPPHPDR